MAHPVFPKTQPTPQTLIVPGFHGSGAAHWQSWLARQHPNTIRLTNVDWESPKIEIWAQEIIRLLKKAKHPVWIVAHSFGCLASVFAGALYPEKIAGALLVAPADPKRFCKQGLIETNALLHNQQTNLAAEIVTIQNQFPSLVVGSMNDPWLKFSDAIDLANDWGSKFINLGNAGHINVESGYGAWPEGLNLLKTLQTKPSQAANLLIWNLENRWLSTMI